LSTDSTVQSGADHLSLIHLIQHGIDADGDGTVDLDRSRIFYFGQSLGASQGIQDVS
jgi:predicted peptidase